MRTVALDDGKEEAAKKGTNADKQLRASLVVSSSVAAAAAAIGGYDVLIHLQSHPASTIQELWAVAQQGSAAQYLAAFADKTLFDGGLTWAREVAIIDQDEGK